jgi:hypothetical protein
VYHAPQDPASIPAPGALAALDASTQALRSATGDLHAQGRAAKSALSSLLQSAGPSRERLREQIAALDGQRGALAARLVAVRGGMGEGREVVTVEECKGARERAGRWEGVARKRRRIVRDMWGMVEESAEGVDLPELKVCGSLGVMRLIGARIGWGCWMRFRTVLEIVCCGLLLR